MEFAAGGEVADPANLPSGCSFHPRCAECFEPCASIRPELQEVEPGRFVSCHLFGVPEGEEE
jgi:oligopeptide/dipeptide ABC transporter ATP-binding protein